MRGIGVALIAITSTRSFSCRNSSFCLTPKRCSSSTTSSPRSFGAYVARQQPVGADQDVHLAAWANLATASRCSAAERNRETCSMVTG